MVRRYFVPRCVGTFVVLALSGSVTAETFAQPNSNDWPQFRGPNQDGVTHETGWTYDWGDRGPKRLWEINIGGGNGAVAVVAGRL